MANDLTRKTEDFDHSIEKVKINKKGPMSKDSHAADAISYMMDSHHREAYERERHFQQQHRIDNRRSGKTFRAILKALELASKGLRVMYVVDYYQEAGRCFHQAMDMSTAYLGDFVEGQRHSPSYRMIFRNGGIIHFVDYDTHRHNCHTWGVHQSHEVIDDYNHY